MTHPRIIVPGATYGITQRCVLRKFFLTPMSPVVNQGFGFILGLAAQKTSAEVHHSSQMPNHGHSCITIFEQDLPIFCRYLFGERSKFMKVALAEHGYEPPENIYRNGRPTVVRQMDESSVLSLIHYQDMNPVKAGLVARVEDYPGFATDLDSMKGRVVVFERPDFYFDPRRSPAQVELRISLPPALLQAYDDSGQVIHHLKRARRQAESKLAAQRTRPVLGARAIQSMNPWAEPRSPRRLGEGPTPTFRVQGLERQIACAEGVTSFRNRHEEARKARLRGEAATFPYGTYGMRILHNAPIDEPPPADSFGVDMPGLPKPSEVSDVPGTDGEYSSREISEQLYQASAEALEAVDPEDTLVARLLDAEPDVVTRDQQRPQEEPETTERPRKAVVLRRSTRTARRRRQQIQADRAAAKQKARGSDEEQESTIDDFDPNPPPH